ncbi:Tyrosine-protein kinase Wzc [Indibacter alkaliphilus LW1]|uniref:non-specific protein-tyrosine kinase n=1 Tax=Indibacter alkaliphilus (strain CCUG 57479 / KCTC 22604 / LW1) TaxID=1189612 RepID=S2E2J9_INDAL|nr:tyrosine-protein kinase family protein [Indibacter alkaliphilus]EOZ96363.1 Tyrosine-protein kinase Wzc [Indibacter alkaliphilus LW1]
MKISDIIKEIEEEEKEKDNYGISYKLMFHKYLSKWHWFFVSILIFGLSTVLYAYFATSLYQINSTILLRDENKGTEFASNSLLSESQGYSGSSSVENEAEVFRSEYLISKAIEELNFSISFFQNNGFLRWREIYKNEVPIDLLIKEKNEYFNLRELEVLIIPVSNEEFILKEDKKEEKKYKFGQDVKNSYGTFSIQKNKDFFGNFNDYLNSPLKMIFHGDKLSRDISESFDVEIVNKLASVISLTIYAEHPLKGKDLLNKILEIYNREAEEEKNSLAKNTIAFIDEQLVDLTEELLRIENEAEQYKLRNSITDVSAEAQLFLNSTTANRQQVAEITVQIDVLESIEAYMSESGNEFETIPGTLSAPEPTLNELIQNYNKLQQDRERMLRTTQPTNPIVINISEQLTSLRRSIIESIKQIKNSLIISKRSLETSSNQFQSRASRVPTMERELLDINRKQGIKQEHYLLLVQKREEAAITLAAASSGNSKVIDPPSSSEYPVKPNKKIIFGLSLIFGFGLPFGLIYFKDRWDEKVQFKSDVEKSTKVPILGELSRKVKKGVIAISKSKRTMIAEQIRFIRTSLAFATNNKEKKVILVTSGMSGEGKTFFSINLAISLGLAGKKVVVLEFDLRKPALMNALELPKSKGLSEYLDPDSSINTKDIITHWEGQENVSIISCGEIPENPAELMLGERIIKLLSELKNNFDHVIIDSAPVGLVSDAFTLSDFADVTIYMVRYNFSTKAQLNTIEDIRKTKRFKNPMIVLNGAKLEMTYGYGEAYGKSYYQKS